MVNVNLRYFQLCICVYQQGIEENERFNAKYKQNQFKANLSLSLLTECIIRSDKYALNLMNMGKYVYESALTSLSDLVLCDKY